MKRIRRAYSKTVSLIDETAVQIYQSFVGKKKGFLLESYDKNNGRYVFMGKNPEEVIKSKENGLVIEKEDGTTKELSGNPVDLLVISRFVRMMSSLRLQAVLLVVLAMIL